MSQFYAVQLLDRILAKLRQQAADEPATTVAPISTSGTYIPRCWEYPYLPASNLNFSGGPVTYPEWHFDVKPEEPEPKPVAELKTCGARDIDLTATTA